MNFRLHSVMKGRFILKFRLSKTYAVIAIIMFESTLRPRIYIICCFNSYFLFVKLLHILSKTIAIGFKFYKSMWFLVTMRQEIAIGMQYQTVYPSYTVSFKMIMVIQSQMGAVHLSILTFCMQ